MPLVLRTDYYKLVFREKERTRSSPVGVWYEYDRHQVPHLMISMKHEFDWTEDLLVAEVNVITSSLLSRLKAATDIHITMPVCLLFIPTSRLLTGLSLTNSPFPDDALFVRSQTRPYHPGVP